MEWGQYVNKYRADTSNPRKAFWFSVKKTKFSFGYKANKSNWEVLERSYLYLSSDIQRKSQQIL